MQPTDVQKLIENGLPGAKVFVEGDGAHFEAIVVSEQFEGLSRLAKQQLVYNTVKTQLLDGSLHALSIKAFTPPEWEGLDKIMEENPDNGKVDH